MKQAIGSLLLAAAVLTLSIPAQAVELGACESERSKMTFILKSVFRPYLRDHVELADLRQEIIDLSRSMNGWVEDIDECYRTVFRQYGAPVDNASINNGLDWSSSLVAFNKVIQSASAEMAANPERPETHPLWQDLDSDLESYLPEMFIPNFQFEAVASEGGFI